MGIEEDIAKGFQQAGNFYANVGSAIGGRLLNTADKLWNFGDKVVDGASDTFDLLEFLIKWAPVLIAASIALSALYLLK